jgi:uncharacterized membrane protein YphA (DoxX/SURF4 family)
MKTLMRFFSWCCATSAPRSMVLIRLMVGAVFLSEGIQKFLYPAALGSGRFEKIGLPHPVLLATIVGIFEITCGSLVLLGFWTRLAAIPLIVIMITALSTTKLPILQKEGFWKAAHESRTDFAMLLGSTFLFIQGAGRWSIDARIARRRE